MRRVGAVRPLRGQRFGINIAWFSTVSLQGCSERRLCSCVLGEFPIDLADETSSGLSWSASPQPTPAAACRHMSFVWRATQDAPARGTGGEPPARELRRSAGVRGIEGRRSHPSPAPAGDPRSVAPKGRLALVR